MGIIWGSKDPNWCPQIKIPSPIIDCKSLETEVKSTIELRATASAIAVSKPDLDAKAEENVCEAFFKRNFERKITSAKVEKICWQINLAAWMQPFQYDLRCSTAKDYSITHAAAAPRNLAAATTMRSAETELQKHNRTTCNGCRKLQLQNRISTPKQKKKDFDAFFKRILKGKWLAPKLRKSAAKSLSQPGCSHSNTIYAVQLQKTIVLRRQPRHRATLMQPLQCDLHAETELQNTIELCATVSEIAASKPDLDAKAEKRRFWSIC